MVKYQIKTLQLWSVFMIQKRTKFKYFYWNIRNNFNLESNNKESIIS